MIDTLKYSSTPNTSSSSNSSSSSSNNNNSSTYNNAYNTPVTHKKNIANTITNITDDKLTKSSWHVSNSTRTAMTAFIAQLALSNSDDSCDDNLSKIHGFANSIETKLYSLANSYEEYIDPSTVVVRINKLLTQCLNDMGPNEINPMACADIINCDINDSPTLADFLSISLSPSFAATPTTKSNDYDDDNMTITNDTDPLPVEPTDDNKNETPAIKPSLDNKAGGLSSAGCNRHFIITILEKVTIIIINNNYLIIIILLGS